MIGDNAASSVFRFIDELDPMKQYSAAHEIIRNRVNEPTSRFYRGLMDTLAQQPNIQTSRQINADDLLGHDIAGAQGFTALPYHIRAQRPGPREPVELIGQDFIGSVCSEDDDGYTITGERVFDFLCSPMTMYGSLAESIARQYNKWRIKYVEYIFVPVVGTTYSGSVVAGTYTDIDEPDNLEVSGVMAVRQVSATPDATAWPVYQIQTMTPAAAADQTYLTQLGVDGPTGSLLYPHRLIIVASSNIGTPESHPTVFNVFMKYHLEFLDPKTDLFLSNWIQSDLSFSNNTTTSSKMTANEKMLTVNTLTTIPWAFDSSTNNFQILMVVIPYDPPQTVGLQAWCPFWIWNKDVSNTLGSGDASYAYSSYEDCLSHSSPHCNPIILTGSNSISGVYLASVSAQYQKMSRNLAGTAPSYVIEHMRALKTQKSDL